MRSLLFAPQILGWRVTDRDRVRIRFVWYAGIEDSMCYDQFEDGLIAHARPNDAVRWYHVADDGTEIILFDDPLPNKCR